VCAVGVCCLGFSPMSTDGYGVGDVGVIVNVCLLDLVVTEPRVTSVLMVCVTVGLALQQGVPLLLWLSVLELLALSLREQEQRVMSFGVGFVGVRLPSAFPVEVAARG
jgi:hypothetical protein